MHMKVIYLAIVYIHPSVLQYIHRRLHSIINIKGALMCWHKSDIDGQPPCERSWYLLWPLTEYLHACLETVTSSLKADQHFRVEARAAASNDAAPVVVEGRRHGETEINGSRRLREVPNDRFGRQNHSALLPWAYILLHERHLTTPDETLHIFFRPRHLLPLLVPSAATPLVANTAEGVPCASLSVSAL